MTTELFRKKPVVIEAFQLTRDLAFRCLTRTAAAPFGLTVSGDFHPAHGIVYSASISIKTLEGVMRANIDDWIIRGVKGECYPCKPDIFAATYEPASVSPPPPRDEIVEALDFAVRWIQGLPTLSPAQAEDKAAALKALGQPYDRAALSTLEGQS